MCKLSIVLTVYNKDLYLHRALDALLNQQNVQEDDYEILAVNDGSTDGSASILEEYAQRDSRVRILTQLNQGLSMARNKGTEAAKGEYVWYVDADDIFANNAVNLICHAIEEKPDVIPIYAITQDIATIRNAISVNVKTGFDVLLDSNWEVCGTFYVLRRAFLKMNNLKFFAGIYHEDNEFTPRMLFFAKSVRVIPTVLYTVIHVPGSITEIPRPKRAFDYLTVSERLSRFVTDQNISSSAIGKAIDTRTAININMAFLIISQNAKEEQLKFNNSFFEKRQHLIQAIKNANGAKYKTEAILFWLFPKHSVSAYRMMKVLSK